MGDTVIADSVTGETVWLAYRGLHRYMKYGARTVGPISVPARLSPEPYGRGMVAANFIARLIPLLEKQSPDIARDLPDPLYRTYLFLWSQLLRCSFRYAPVRTTDGWENIAWWPLSAFVAAPTDNPEEWTLDERGESCWKGWVWFHNHHLLDARRCIVESEVRRKFPWMPTDREAGLKAIALQLPTLQQLQGQNDSWRSAAKVFRYYDAVGNERRADGVARCEWHPWLVCARLQTWTDMTIDGGPLYHQSPMVKETVEDLLASPEDLRSFFDEATPLANPYANPKAAKLLIIDGFDRLIGWDSVVGGFTLPQKRTWRRLRRRWTAHQIEGRRRA